MTSSPWQCGGGRGAAVLRAVLGWLAAEELARAGRVCRAWRRAAADGGLWRRLLRAAAPAGGHTLRLLREYHPHVSWRQEYVRLAAGWRGAGRGLRAGSGAGLQHAALDAAGRQLALGADDGSLTIWERAADDEWELSWECSVAAHGWISVERVQWAPAAACGGRLLLAGPLALTDRWELLVLQPSGGGWQAAARAGCAAGAAGCWAADGEAFLALELRRLAPRRAITTVWLNAATQEPQSEFAGVTTPLMHVYNEDSGHITHALVAAVSLAELAAGPPDDAAPAAPSAAYYRATEMRRVDDDGPSTQLLVCASFGGGGLLRAWPLPAARPPPLRAAAAGDLAARRRALRAAPAPAAQPAPEPDEPAVRAMCRPPAAHCRLGAAVLGLQLHPSGRCVWASAADGAACCVSLPALRHVLRLPPSAAPPPATALYYMQPAVCDRYIASPAPGRSGRLHVWSALSGAACRAPPASPDTAAPALAAALVSSPADDGDMLLVMAGDTVHVWRSRATPQPAA